MARIERVCMGSNEVGLLGEGSRRLESLARHFCLNKPTIAQCCWLSQTGCGFGEVSLPGGKVEEGDAGYVDTALRETKEEIGLDPSQFNLVTVLELFIAKGDVLVVPVVGVLSNKQAFNPVPNTAEVEAIFDAPLEMFLKDENRRAEEAEWQGEEFICNYFDFETDNKNYVIWALTAAILITAASLVYQRPPAFPERRPKIWSTGAASRPSMT